jgi:serine protease SohB
MRLVNLKAAVLAGLVQSSLGFAAPGTGSSNKVAFQQPLSKQNSQNAARFTASHLPTTSSARGSSSSTARSFVASSTQLALAVPPVPVEAKAMANELTLYFFQTLISVGVPAVVTVVAIGLIFGMARKNREEDGRGSQRGGGSSGGFGSMMMGIGSNNKKNQRFNGEASFDGGINAAEELYDDLYGSDEEDMMPFNLQKLFGGGKGRGLGGGANKQKSMINAGIPGTQYIKIDRLNDIYTSYQFSMDAATKSKAYAAAKVRRSRFDRAIGKAVRGPAEMNGSSASVTLTQAEETDLLREERVFLKDASALLADIQSMQSKVTEIAIGRAMEEMEVEIGELDPHQSTAISNDKAKGLNATDAEIVSSNSTLAAKAGAFSFSIKNKDKKGKNYETELNKLYKDMGELLVDLTDREASFIQSAVQILGPSRANGIRVAMLGNVNSPQGQNPGSLTRTLQERPLVVVLKELGIISSTDKGLMTTSTVIHEQPGRRVFVTDFPGDVTASQVTELREEVTAIVQAAQPGDEALLVLESGGGTVTGYGLAAAQLKRFKAAGMSLTICVEQVAASGGYMMCCVADKIIASPFAVLGSIGVISDMPNVYERLKKEGIEFQTVTAGKYKRTLTPTKKVTKEDLQKSKEDIEQILNLFKGFVAKNRPQLDIDAVATGETWFGEDAMDRKLCDAIQTKDEILLDYITHQGCDVYQVRYEEPEKAPASLSGLPFGSASRTNESLLRKPINWLVRTISQEVQAEMESMMKGGALTSGNSAAERVMAVDTTDAANRVKATINSNEEGSQKRPFTDENIFNMF